jgi:hypothetical protein
VEREEPEQRTQDHAGDEDNNMSCGSLVAAMGAAQGKQMIFWHKRLIAFRANRSAKAPRGWQYIRKIVNQASDEEAQKDADK